MQDDQLLDGLEQLAANIIVTVKFEPPRGTLPGGFEVSVGRVAVFGESLREALEGAISAVI